MKEYKQGVTKDLNKIEVAVKIRIFFVLMMIIIPLVNATATDVNLLPVSSFIGKQLSGRIGYYLSAAGDVNSDGNDDFMIGSYHTSLHGWNSGAVFLMLGSSFPKWQLNSSVAVADAVFRGKDDYDMVGYNIAGEGDFNGDGFDDVLIGAPGNWERKVEMPGSAYIVFGNAAPTWGDDFVLEDYADVIVIGESRLDQFGYAVTFIGDINHDGFDDLLCGAPFRNQFNEWDGKVYLILGRKELTNRRLYVAGNAIASFVYPSYQGELGSAVTGVGDVNQDGFADFLIGAAGIGKSFLILGRSSLNWGLNFNLNQADCIFLPEEANDDAGWQVKNAGDVNGDGYPDMLISGLQINNESGKVYLICGRAKWPRELSLSDANASFIGEKANDQAGVAINGGKDFNGDGYDDVLIGARYYGNVVYNYHKGKVYLVTGKRYGWQRDQSLRETLTYFVGEDTVNCAGWGVSYAGDVNGDLREDFILSAPFNNEGGHFAGKVYMFAGNHPLSQISGKVSYFANHAPVADVNLQLSSDFDMTRTTDKKGCYRFDVPAGHDIQIYPEKEVSSDIHAHSISMYDAALTAAHACSTDTLSGLAAVAADVNRDHEITIQDAKLIAYYAMQLPVDTETYVGEWKFSPECREYKGTDLPASAQDYQGILLGDPSGDWRSSQFEDVITKVNIEQLQVAAAAEVIIPIVVDANSVMISAQIEMTFDPLQFEFVSVEATALTKDFQLFSSVVDDDNIVAGLYGISPVTEAGTIMRLHFKIIAKNEQIGCITLNKCQINNQAPWEAEILIDYRSLNTMPGYSLLNNYPNPFNSGTSINFQMRKPAHVTLKILNINGQEVKALVDSHKPAGEHKVYWSGIDNNGNTVVSGVYFCHLNYNGTQQTRKLIMLK